MAGQIGGGPPGDSLVNVEMKWLHSAERSKLRTSINTPNSKRSPFGIQLDDDPLRPSSSSSSVIYERDW